MSVMYNEPTRITYYDLDCRGKLKLSAFLRLAHIAADINANRLGIGFNDLAPLSMSFVLQRFGLSITRLPVYDETVSLRTWPASIAKGVFTRRGDLYDAAGKKLMEWTSLWVLLDLNTRKILRPSALPVALPETGAQGVTVEAQKISPAPEGSEAFSSHKHIVRYNEVDTNLHMNNTVYGDLIGNALFLHDTAAISGEWSGVQINYLSEMRLGETADIICRKQGGLFHIEGSAHGKTAFTATVVCQ